MMPSGWKCLSFGTSKTTRRYLMAGAPQQKMRVIAVLLLAVIILTLSSCGTGKQAVNEPAGTPKPISDLTFSGIRQQRKDALKIEDWEKLRDTLIGQRVQWTGRVLHVTEPKKAGSPYEIAIDMDPSGIEFSYDDVIFLLPKDQATSLAKDQGLTFQGDIQEINEMKGTVDLVLTIRLDKVTIMP